MRNIEEVMSQQNHSTLNVRFLHDIKNDKIPNNEKNINIVSNNIKRD